MESGRRTWPPPDELISQERHAVAKHRDSHPIPFSKNALMTSSTSKPLTNADRDRALALCRQAVDNPDADYAAQERLFAELDELLLGDEGMPRWLLDNPAFQELRWDLLRVRAAYEYERERFLAEAIIEAGDESPLEAFRSSDSYENAHDFEWSALAPFNPERALFVGAGPFPTTAISFMRAYPQASVACIERHEEGCRLAAEVARICGCEDLRIIHRDALEITDFSDYDCVHVGTVVGVLADEKREIVEHFKARVPASTLLVFRTAVGPGTIIFPSVDLETLEDVPYRVLPNPPQKTYTMILTERVSPAA